MSWMEGMSEREDLGFRLQGKVEVFRFSKLGMLEEGRRLRKKAWLQLGHGN